MATDEEFPPLLQPGLQKMTIADLKALVLDGFPKSKSRKELWQNFSELVGNIAALGIKCEIWVDGSFLTEKIDPSDVDFVVDVPIDLVQTFNEQQQGLLEDLKNREFRRSKKLHSFVMFRAPLGHNFYPASQESHKQWSKDFGYSYIKKEPKGIAVVEVAP
jgi:hypothetical protein